MTSWCRRRGSCAAHDGTTRRGDCRPGPRPAADRRASCTSRSDSHGLSIASLVFSVAGTLLSRVQAEGNGGLGGRTTPPSPRWTAWAPTPASLAAELLSRPAFYVASPRHPPHPGWRPSSRASAADRGELYPRSGLPWSGAAPAPGWPGASGGGWKRPAASRCLATWAHPADLRWKLLRHCLVRNGVLVGAWLTEWIRYDEASWAVEEWENAGGAGGEGSGAPPPPPPPEPPRPLWPDLATEVAVNTVDAAGRQLATDVTFRALQAATARAGGLLGGADGTVPPAAAWAAATASGRLGRALHLGGAAATSGAAPEAVAAWRLLKPGAASVGRKAARAAAALDSGSSTPGPLVLVRSTLLDPVGFLLPASRALVRSSLLYAAAVTLADVGWDVLRHALARADAWGHARGWALAADDALRRWFRAMAALTAGALGADTWSNALAGARAALAVPGAWGETREGPADDPAPRPPPLADPARPEWLARQILAAAIRAPLATVLSAGAGAVAAGLLSPLAALPPPPTLPQLWPRLGRGASSSTIVSDASASASFAASGPSSADFTRPALELRWAEWGASLGTLAAEIVIAGICGVLADEVATAWLDRKRKRRRGGGAVDDSGGRDEG